MISLTLRQTECLDFLVAYQRQHGVAPTVRELATGIKAGSTQRAHELLVALEGRGAIRRLPGKARAIEIVESQAASFHLDRILSAIIETGFIRSDDPIIADAMKSSRAV